MIGGEALLRTLVASGVDACFANPGTSEMHFVAALDRVPGMRPVLGLFEGVVTGAADGYGRMTGRPAATLLHLGPGLANGLANLHNARRASTPIVNVVGDHATYHARFDAPLQSDIGAIASTLEGWYRRTERTADVAADAADAVAAAIGPPGRVATLVLPADVSWGDGAEPAAPVTARRAATADTAVVESAAKALVSGERTVVLLGGAALRGDGPAAAARLAAATGATVLAETFPARAERGAGRPEFDRLSYLGEFAAAQLAGARHLLLAGARSPVSFFAYPDKPSDLVPAGCDVVDLAIGDADPAAGLLALVDAVGAPDGGPPPDRPRPTVPADGPLTAEAVAAVVGGRLPDGAIVADEANTSGLWLAGATAGAPPHDWLTLTGGAIGQGLPLATGAAVACPDRPVVCLEADGSAMYTIQALWTQARESLDVTTVVLTNRAYAVLRMELARVGATGGAGESVAASLLDLHDPELDVVAIAEGFGVPATRATTVAEFDTAFRRALETPGPSLVDAVVPPAL